MGPVALFVGGLAAGLVAGAASCTAVQGGLLAGLTSGPKVVGLFLTGRLASHVVAGALLGLLGSAVRLAPATRAALLVAAGIVVAGFGLRLLLRGARACPPRKTPRLASGTAPAQGTACAEGTACAQATTPAEGVSPAEGTPPARGIVHAARTVPIGGRAVLLGAVTVLLPCGVTLSTQTVAVSSGSALGGAAVMAGFVAGTAPAFALLGLVVQRIAATRLAAVAGVLALAAGLWTASSGLRLGGWLPDPSGPPAVQPAAGRPGAADGVQRIDVWATDRGYRPGIVTARAGVPVEIAFHVAGNPGCARTLTVDGRDVALPAVVRLGPQRPGSLRYVCSMGMYTGFITFA
ncbi:hypothetical protein GCM10010156_43410 [Planobispora rosea]|uniref:Urease accessory protein UreH-like transmembrane domain-containing protein n=1 Tax=Planobispora rosea TaxID=35762 RepID=A0A8J3WDC1_PLARO|nr:sulfite exporter TauE/SafE family protein [Planobispora rosea]GGS79949.1 hypothetical protein GCM10010156_43410 [Planobispora rosea]GIH85804.1 hypothetical protein Pro02_42120 [Planobispora rosea]